MACALAWIPSQAWDPDRDGDRRRHPPPSLVHKYIQDTWRSLVLSLGYALQPNGPPSSGQPAMSVMLLNLGLICIFSISRIGKVPGKRSKANRAAAAAAALAASSSSSTLTSNSSTSLTLPLNRVPSSEALRASQPAQRPQEDELAASRPPHLAIAPASAQDPSSIITPAQDYSSSIQYYTGDCPNEASNPSLPLPDVLPTPSHAPYACPANVDFGLPDLSHLSWTTELDQLSSCGLPTPGLEIPAIAKGPLPSDRRLGQIYEWEMDDGSSSSVDPSRTSTASLCHPVTPPDFNVLEESAAYPVHHVESVSCSTYLYLLHDIEQTTTIGHTLDSVLAANQRYLSTLLQMTEIPGFEHAYDAHLLFTVALSKVISLFSAGYRDFLARMEGHALMGGVDRLIRFGVFEIDFVEQKAICRSILLRELKRARLCLVRLVDVLSRQNETCGAGRHEGLCEEMGQRLDLLAGSLEGSEL
ncbi:hypothetical protein EYZ11_007878 [Aspergillus tanneri]|uniref:Aflatoxin regulatory protein domain-containing protein n=1 Tax=Aspergillus tanneri TaxID=1220188 RepID=A0A4S3JE39_9EURO|nr:hypothetical protein EYZ11_007878 [Aspergillus tanneri]